MEDQNFNSLKLKDSSSEKQLILKFEKLIDTLDCRHIMFGVIVLIFINALLILNE